MLAEIKTLFWLQGRLTLAMFRSRRADSWARLGRAILVLIMFVASVPFFGALGLGLAFLLARISTAGALELAALTNAGLLFMWLLMPASYSSEMIERIELPRLFVHPISQRGLTAGSTLMAAFSILGIGSLLVLLGELAGLAWHGPLALPLVLAGTLATFAIMLLIGRLIEDVFDLVASDRRLRGLLLSLMTLPFLLILFGSYALQIVAANEVSIVRFLTPLFGTPPDLHGLGFIRGVDVILNYMHLSRFLNFLPTSWGTSGVAMTLMGRWAPGLALLGLSLIFAGALFAVHASLTRRMMEGNALHMSSERVRSRGLAPDLPGATAFWALIGKDWAYLRRSPMTRQVLVSMPILIVVFGFSAWQIGRVLPTGSDLLRWLPVVAGGILAVSINLAMMNTTANYFGAIDREGLSALMLSPVDRRYVLLSAGLVTTAFALVQSLVVLVLVAAVTGAWQVLPWGLALALSLQVSTLPAYILVAILSPYRAKMVLVSQNQGNLWMVIAWLLGSIPALALCVLPYFLYPPALFITLPLAVVLSVALYAATLKPLAALLDRRAHRIMEVVGQEA